MKKTIVRIVIGLLVLLVIALGVVMMSLDGIIKKGVETAGPMVTKVTVKLDHASVSPMSGSGGLTGLEIGNPDGFKAPLAIKVGDVSVSVKVGSVLSDKVVVHSINVKAPEITMEGSLKGNNLSKLLANINSFTAGQTKGAAPATKEEKAASKKLQVDEFVISGGKINLAITELGGKSATVPLPEIRLSNMGDGPDGITPGELASKVISAVLESSTKTVTAQLGQLAKEVAGKATEIGKGAVNDAKDTVKGLGGLFKK